MTLTIARPTTLPVIADAIPVELRARPQWVCWSWAWIEGRKEWTKPPINARTGGHAESDNPKTWTDFDTAMAAYLRNGWDGIGYVVSIDDPFTGIDLDKCRDPETGEIEPWAAEIIRRFDSYTEVSPSGRGIRIWIKGTLIGLLADDKQGSKRGAIEAYSGKKYLTVTGHQLIGGAA